MTEPDALPPRPANVRRASLLLAAGTTVSRILGFVSAAVLAWTIGLNNASANATRPLVMTDLSLGLLRHAATINPHGSQTQSIVPIKDPNRIRVLQKLTFSVHFARSR